MLPTFKKDDFYTLHFSTYAGSWLGGGGLWCAATPTATPPPHHDRDTFNS